MMMPPRVFSTSSTRRTRMRSGQGTDVHVIPLGGLSDFVSTHEPRLLTAPGRKACRRCAQALSSRFRSACRSQSERVSSTPRRRAPVTSGARARHRNRRGSCLPRGVAETRIMDVTLATSVDEYFHEVVTDALTAVELDASEPASWYLVGPAGRDDPHASHGRAARHEARQRHRSMQGSVYAR